MLQIAKASEGSVRDALSLVEQAAAFGNGKLDSAVVENMLGRLSIERIYDLLDAVCAGNAAEVLAQIESLAEYAPDYEQLLGDALSVLHAVAVVQTAGR